MLRLIRAVIAGREAEPGLNAWYDSDAVGRRVLDKIDLAIAVDSADGLLDRALESAMCNKFVDRHADVARNLSQQDRRDVTAAMVRHGCSAAVGMTELLVGAALTHFFETQTDEDLVDLSGLENREVRQV